MCASIPSAIRAPSCGVYPCVCVCVVESGRGVVPWCTGPGGGGANTALAPSLFLSLSVRLSAAPTLARPLTTHNRTTPKPPSILPPRSHVTLLRLSTFLASRVYFGWQRPPALSEVMCVFCGLNTAVVCIDHKTIIHGRRWYGSSPRSHQGSPTVTRGSTRSGVSVVAGQGAGGWGVVQSRYPREISALSSYSKREHTALCRIGCCAGGP